LRHAATCLATATIFLFGGHRAVTGILSSDLIVRQVLTGGVLVTASTTAISAL
jgi:hypothetical protein